MRFPPVRLLWRWVAGAAALTLVAALSETHLTTTDRRVVIPVGCVVASTYGVWGMRRPWASLIFLVALWVAVPQVDHPSRDVVGVSVLGSYVGWVIGAPAGWIFRKRSNASAPRAASPRENSSADDADRRR